MPVHGAGQRPVLLALHRHHTYGRYPQCRQRNVAVAGYTPWILALDPHGAPCRTSPSVELHATLVSAPIQAELEASQHVYAEQWARPPVQWGNVQWDRSLEIAIAAELSKIAIANELSQLPRGRTAASQGARRMLTYPATCPIKGTRAAFLGVQCF